MILTNILLAILVGFKIKKYLEKNKQNTEYVDLRLKETDKVLKRLESKVLSVPLDYQKEMGISSRRITNLTNNIDAHKVFTAKSLAELREDIDRSKNKEDWKDEVISDKDNKWGGGKINPDYKKLTKSIRKPKGLKFTDFQLHKEIFRYEKKKGQLFIWGWKKIADISLWGIHFEDKYKKLRKDAYQRLWARANYKLKQ